MVEAKQLRPNPKNWRTHPKAQQDALRGVLAEVGIADAVLARQLSDGSLMLIDGHLRAETMPDQKIPVLVLDVNEAEADKLLATLDPLAAMADSNSEQLEELLRNVETGNEALQAMITNTAARAGIHETPGVFEEVQPIESQHSQEHRDYAASSIRQMILVFDQAQYEAVIAALGEHAEKFALSTNTEVILHLLETNGYAVSQRDSA